MSAYMAQTTRPSLMLRLLALLDCPLSFHPSDPGASGALRKCKHGRGNGPDDGPRGGIRMTAISEWCRGHRNEKVASQRPFTCIWAVQLLLCNSFMDYVRELGNRTKLCMHLQSIVHMHMLSMRRDYRTEELKVRRRVRS
ncbi:hypothetical protein N656DRAFT_155196 [Canariomyces notabilis]|uniref:Secreted protein n=1 Tax=Canariomyces notabilis TaxID=2074819 RepID=A0AAN6TBK3_9PEZI|nr:hypothetical protein N656DRAFT_155196 [Canariomyces arenarius]